MVTAATVRRPTALRSGLGRSVPAQRRVNSRCTAAGPVASPCTFGRKWCGARGLTGCGQYRPGSMADQKSLEHLQEVEKAQSHYAELLKQADTALEQANAFVDNYVAAHPGNSTKGPKLSEALKDVRDLLSKATARVNELDGEITEAKREAEQRELADDPYS